MAGTLVSHLLSARPRSGTPAPPKIPPRRPRSRCPRARFVEIPRGPQDRHPRFAVQQLFTHLAAPRPGMLRPVLLYWLVDPVHWIFRLVGCRGLAYAGFLVGRVDNLGGLLIVLVLGD